MTGIVVMASGEGSNFEAIADAVEAGTLAAEIRAVFSDQPGAAVLGKAARRGIPTRARAFSGTRAEYDRGVLSDLAPFAPRFLVMAGYLRIASRELLDAFRGDRGYARVVNIHPSLLPAFPGLGGYAQAFRHGAKVAGATVHLVEEKLDDGPICAQESFPIGGCRSEEEVEAIGKGLEHRLYPETLAWVLPERFDTIRADTTEGRICVRPN